MAEARPGGRAMEGPGAHLSAAYHLALRVTGNEDLAEEAVQEAFVRLLRQPPARSGWEPLASHVLRAVHLSGLDILRRKRARRRREEGYAMDRAGTAASAASTAGERELAESAQRALADLPAELRVAVALCCEQGLTQDEAARVMGVPQRTVSRRVQRGLERLRGRLAGGGLAALGALALGDALRALGVPPAPAHVLERVGPLASKLGTTAHAAPAAAGLKGGLMAKLVAGVVLAGAAAGAVVVVGGGLTPLPSESPRKFTTPVTHPGAEWHLDGVWAGCGISGYLDGPRREIFVFTGPSTKMWFEWAGDFNLRKYEEEIDRYLTLTGGARGWLDGPFTRARFGGWSYGSSGVRTGGSPDGRYLYMVDLGRLRVLDMEKRTVRTLLDKVNAVAVSVDRKGNAWIFSWGGALRIVNVEGKVLETRNLPGNYEKQPLIGHGFCARLDEENNRLWGMKRNGLYLWYWDLAAGGKVVPVLWDARKDGKSRGMCVTGPFEGTQMHCPSGFAFGPDDPEKRFGYMGGGDDTTFYRLDFQKKEWVMFGPPKEHEKRPFKVFRFVPHKGKFPCNSIVSWCGTPGWDEEGNIYLGVALGARTIRYKRVK